MEGKLVGYLNGIPDYEAPPLSLPCENLLEFVKCYLNAYNNRDLEQLDYLLDTEFSQYKDFYTGFDTQFVSNFITRTLYRYCRKINEAAKDDDETKLIKQWMTFDKDALNILLEDAFFDEYRSYILSLIIEPVDNKQLISIISKSGYIDIEFYTYYKVLGLAASLLEFNRTYLLWHFLCYGDYIERIVEHKYNSILSPIYRKFGWQWFSTNKYGKEPVFDKVMYKWAYYAISAEQKMPDSDLNKLISDLTDLYTEYCIKCVQAKIDYANDDLAKYLKAKLEALHQIKDEELARANEVVEEQAQKITVLEEKTKNQRHEIYKLEKTNETLIKSYRTTVKNISLIQSEKDTDITNKIDRILRHLYECLPDELTGDTLKKKFGDIWENLSEYSQDDITKSIKMFEMMQDSEFSTLALLRSVERELELNVFQPFRESELFKNIEDFSCTFKKVEGTHKSLQRPVTLGSIPFIGRDVNNERYIQESLVLQAFAEFLGDKKEVFTEICRSIDQYKIDNGMKSIVDLRNGIAHGDAAVTEFCDESCYHDICKFIYEPPIQIMFSIILHSLKSK